VIPDTPGNTTRTGHLQRLARQVMETEYEHLKVGDRRNSITLPWMPFQPASFLGFMWDSLAVLDGPVFLDVGCGPGTKMRLAKELFGMIPYGIEIDADMAELARPYGNVYVGDAMTLPAIERIYARADLIWLYRPFRDPEHEKKLEDLIIANMKPGAILAGGAWETEVPMLGWEIVVDDWEIRHGAWQKPRNS
jgi:SAM-dependent methyltransferase